MFRSGRLTKARLNQILRRAEATPHNLRVVAKACMILPQDLLAWFAAGQDPQCTDPLMVELAWEINKLRADVAARNYARIEAAANVGKKTKTVTKPNPDKPDEPIVEVTVEDVLPAAWAIEKIEEMAGASHWEISPDAEQAEELHRMMQALSPTPLLPAGSLQESREGVCGGGPDLPALGGGGGTAHPEHVETVSGLTELAGRARAGAVDEAGGELAGEDGRRIEHDQTLTGPE